MKRTHGMLIGLGLLVVAFIVVMEIGGFRSSMTGAATGDEGSGCVAEAPPSVAVPDEKPADVRVAPSSFEAPEAPSQGPLDASSSLAKGRYVVSISPAGVVDPGVGDDGIFRVGSRPVDDAFGALQARALAPAFSNLRPDVSRVTALGLDRVFVFESDAAPDEVLDSLYEVDEVEWVEQDRVEKIHVDDPYYGYQWHMHQLDVTSVWGTTDGSSVVVAVIDTGVSANEDGYASVLPGIDLVDNDGDPADEYGHGTHVAGTIAQATNNALGVVGVAPGAAILPVRVLDANGSGYASLTAEGIRWAADNGAQVINMSLGGDGYSSVQEAACDYAYAAGVVVVASSGNGYYTNFVSYPAANEAVIAVGATDFNRDIAPYSNQGAAIELSAPGGDTDSDHNGDGYPDGVLQEAFLTPYNLGWGYYFLQGTSMAAPHVSGVAALLVANGTESPEDVREALTATAQDLGDAGRDTVYGYGFIDPAAALAYAGQQAPVLEIEGLRAREMGPRRAMIRWFTSVPSSHVVTGDNGFSNTQASPARSHRALVRGASGATVEFELTAEAEDGSTATETISVTFQ